VRFEAWDAWGRKWMELGWLVVPVMSGPSPTPEPRPSATPTPTAGVATATPTMVGVGVVLPTPLATFTPGPTPTLRPLGGVVTATPLPTATPVPAHTGLVGEAPAWAKTVVVGALFAGVALLWWFTAWLAKQRRIVRARRVSRAELVRRQRAHMQRWHRRQRRRVASTALTPRVRVSQRDVARKKYLKQWLRWEMETEARWRARRIAQADQAFDAEVGDEAEIDAITRETRAALANRIFTADRRRIEAQGGHSLSNPFRQRHMAQREAPPADTAPAPPVSGWKKAWHAVTQPVETMQNVLIGLGRRSPLARKVLEATANTVHAFNRAMAPVVQWVDAHQQEVSLMVGLTAGLLAVVVTGGGALPLVLTLAVTLGLTGGMTVGLNAYYGRRWTENLGTNLLLGAGGVGLAFVQAWAFQAVMGRVASPVAVWMAQFCQAHPLACNVAQPLLWLADKGWNAYDAWQAGRVLKDPDARWEEKWTAGLSLVLATMSEALEGGGSSFVDDATRKVIEAEFRERLAREGPEGTLDWMQKRLGDEAFQRWWTELEKAKMTGLSVDEAVDIAQALRERIGTAKAMAWLRRQIGEEAFRSRLLRAEIRERDPALWAYSILVDMQATGASEEVLQGVRRLVRQIEKEKTFPAYRWGLIAQLDRAYTWYRQGLLEGVEVTIQRGRVDLVLVTKEIVEVKYWRQSYAKRHIPKLLDQIQTYQATGRPVILELVQTKRDPITEDFIRELLAEAQNEGIPLTREQIRIVPLGGP